jgi:hypothetical protein
VTSPQLNILPSPSHLPPHSHFRSLFDHDHSLRLKGGLLTMASTCTPSLFSTFPTPILHRVKAAGLAASCRFHHHRPFPSLILSPWGSRNPRLALLSINCDFLYRLEGFWQSRCHRVSSIGLIVCSPLCCPASNSIQMRRRA